MAVLALCSIHGKWRIDQHFQGQMGLFQAPQVIAMDSRGRESRKLVRAALTYEQMAEIPMRYWSN